MITENKRTTHPMLLVAGIALILFCAAGTAAIMGWLPDSFARNTESAELAKANQLAIDNAKDEAEKVAAEKARRITRNAKAQSAAGRVASNVTQTCASCGVIESVRAIETRGEGSGVGAVGGAVVGGLLGNQVGDGNGKKAMTVVGAIGGALAGNHIEKRVKSTTNYEIVVRMENGSSRTMTETNQPAWRNGDRVKVVDGVIRSA